MVLDMLDMEVDVDSDETWSGEALGLEECLFCQHVSDNLEKNIQHMTVEHSFFIPDIEYLVDLEGFIAHLGKYMYAQFANSIIIIITNNLGLSNHWSLTLLYLSGSIWFCLVQSSSAVCVATLLCYFYS